MSDSNQPVIVGAGPVGLGTALFLAQQGVTTRVVEMLEEPVHESKALAINPRTLEILESTGITAQMLELGLRVHEARMHRGEKAVASISLAGAHPRYPFMLALSQATTERLLTQAFTSAGGYIERGVRLVGCRNLSDHVEAVLRATQGGTREVVECPWLLAADGAHSAVREQLGIQFEGSALDNEWYLVDVPIRTKLPEDVAHVFFLANGAFLLLIRVVDNAFSHYESPLWRVIANRPDPLAHLVMGEPVGPPVWESSFRISHRICTKLSSGNVYFAGDAAHIHSPMGARGMNLGLEDAWVFAELVKANRLSEYDHLRRPVDRRVVRQVEFLTRMMTGEAAFSGILRRFIFPMAIKLPPLRNRMVRTLTGLDHNLPRFVGATVPSVIA
jgi:2-polyprenyl-6-methoxyphenol hydroxylase-like FAD-dependent oxidoreductase